MLGDGGDGTSASPSMARMDSAVFVGNDGRALINDKKEIPKFNNTRSCLFLIF
jgi:hypothetical protein